jgi:hypothetical protein
MKYYLNYDTDLNGINESFGTTSTFDETAFSNLKEGDPWPAAVNYKLSEFKIYNLYNLYIYVYYKGYKYSLGYHEYTNSILKCYLAPSSTPDIYGNDIDKYLSNLREFNNSKYIEIKFKDNEECKLTIIDSKLDTISEDIINTWYELSNLDNNVEIVSEWHWIPIYQYYLNKNTDMIDNIIDYESLFNELTSNYEN